MLSMLVNKNAMMNRNIVLFMLFLGSTNSVIADAEQDLEKFLPKEEKVGDWSIEIFEHPMYYYKTPDTDITAYIQTDNGNVSSVAIECLHSDRYAAITFYLVNLGMSFQEQYVDVDVRIDENEAIRLANRKSIAIDIYIAGYDEPYSNKETKLLKQMQNGNVMVFEISGAKKGTSSEISLNGFAEAYKVLEKSCTGMTFS